MPRPVGYDPQTGQLVWDDQAGSPQPTSLPGRGGGAATPSPEGGSGQIPSIGASDHPPQLFLSPGDIPPENRSPTMSKGVVNTAMGLLGDATALGVGLTGPGGLMALGAEESLPFLSRLALRGGLDTAAGATSGAFHGENPSERAIQNGVMGAGSYGLADQLPRKAYEGALALGGIGKRYINKIPDIADSFMKLRDQYTPFNAARSLAAGEVSPSVAYARSRGLVPGATSRMNVSRQAAGKEIEGLEDAATAAGASADIRPPVFNTAIDMLHDADMADKPSSFMSHVGQDAADFVNQHTSIRNGNPHLGVRDIRELGRRQIKGGQGIMDQRAEGAFIPEDAQLGAQIQLNRGGALKDAGMDAANKTPFGKSLAAKEEEFGHLARVSAANKTLTNSGKWWGPIGRMGARGAAGAGIGMGLGSLLGVDKSTSASIGGLASLGLGSPGNIARLGSLAGRVAQTGPTIYRAYELLKDAGVPPEKIMEILRSGSFDEAPASPTPTRLRTP